MAVHTTEFNLQSPAETFEEGSTVVYRESDIIAFAEELTADRHLIQLNLHPGYQPADLIVDRDRNSDIYLRLYVRNKSLATSLGSPRPQRLV